MKELERIRWRCRRGMLELDILLERFIEQHYANLDAVQREAFDALLDMPDVELWDMITGKATREEKCRAVLELLQAA